VAASFNRVEPKITGRPGYAPADLLKLYIYGYLNRVPKAALMRSAHSSF
jgi:transposase